jgi:hypothetical protein
LGAGLPRVVGQRGPLQDRADPPALSPGHSPRPGSHRRRHGVPVGPGQTGVVAQHGSTRANASHGPRHVIPPSAKSQARPCHRRSPQTHHDPPDEPGETRSVGRHMPPAPASEQQARELRSALCAVPLRMEAALREPGRTPAPSRRPLARPEQVPATESVWQLDRQAVRGRAIALCRTDWPQPELDFDGSNRAVQPHAVDA